MRTKRPAQIKRASAKASCPGTSIRRNHEPRAFTVQRVPWRNPASTASEIVVHPGIMPNKIVAAKATTIVKASTRPSGATEIVRGIGLDHINGSSIRLNQNAISTPANPDTTDKRRLSVNNCRIKRPRPAPRARRRLISPVRDADRANNRLARLTQTRSSRMPATAIKTWSVPVKRFRRNDCPRAPESTRIRCERNSLDSAELSFDGSGSFRMEGHSTDSWLLA